MESDVKNEIGKKSIELTILNKHIRIKSPILIKW